MNRHDIRKPGYVASIMHAAFEGGTEDGRRGEEEKKREKKFHQRLHHVRPGQLAVSEGARWVAAYARMCVGDICTYTSVCRL